MSQELEGLEYLKANKKQVETMTCDKGRPYCCSPRKIRKTQKCGITRN